MAIDSSGDIEFSLNAKLVRAKAGETIWQVAARLGVEIPHLCYKEHADYRADGNCRACMVEIEGERVLAASCIRLPSAGMQVRTASDKAEQARSIVLELLLADMPPADKAHEKDSHFANMQAMQKVNSARFPKRAAIACDDSHLAMRVNLDACIHCNLCVRACREVQVNDVIGMSGRGKNARISFDFGDAMGESTCVACGECVQACPTGALMPASMLDDAQVEKPKADKIVNSLCPFCGVGCQTEVHVRDNKIIKVDGRDGPANRSRLCVKGRFGMDYSSHPHRLTKPLIRKDNVGKKWNDQVDPANPESHFRVAEWDEAIALVVQGFKRIHAQHGGDAIAGFGSAKGSNEEAYLFQKLIRSAFATNNVDHCTRLCHASSVAALLEGIGSGAVSAPFTTAEFADCMIVIGARPAQNHPVAATFFKQAAKRGCKIIVIDPRRQGLNRHAWKHLQFKPGTDVALLNAMLNCIISEDLIDRQYVAAHVNNFDAIKAKVESFTPESMQDICGISADEIRATARVYAQSSRSIIFWGMGISQHVHGTDNARCLISLASITGQVGREGTGLHPLRGQNNVQGASDVGLIPMVFPDYKSVEDNEVRSMYEKLWGAKLNNKPGLTVVEIINAILADKLKGMYIMGENPAMSDPDARHAREALAKLEHLVVQEIFLTETAFHADIILPASSFPEKSGTFTNTNRQVQLARPALDLPGSARQDWHIIQSIAQGLGLDWNYGDVGEIYEEMRQSMQSISGISWKRLQQQDSVTYPCHDENSAGREILFAESFPTADGRVSLVPTDLIPPAEIPDDDYPLVLTTGRLLEHWHTGAMTRRAEVLDGIEPEAVAHLNPRQMQLLDISAGEFITVSTRRGSIALKARADRDVAEGMVFIPFCFAEGAANMLTNPQLDPYGKIPEFKFCAARIEKPSVEV